MPRAAIGLGSNLGAPSANLQRALQALKRLGRVVACSRFYQSKPWGVMDQPAFCNAVALLETDLEPHALLRQLKSLERELGRVPSERWGPRLIDLDILTYGDRRVDEPDLQIPHARLYERAFALVPLAEVDAAYRAALAGLPPEERESVALMSEDQLVQRVRTLAQAFLETDLVRLRIEDEDENAVEFRRKPAPVQPQAKELEAASAPAAPLNVERIKADLVGIVHLTRPLVGEGEMLAGDRELAYVEALGIRNPIRSLGKGRIVGIRCEDGRPVEYGQVLFEIDRG
jgi:2-amino-4-hydroxy-6-hydroxymethyldihydropteridine diphosphokinase